MKKEKNNSFILSATEVAELISDTIMELIKPDVPEEEWICDWDRLNDSIPRILTIFDSLGVKNACEKIQLVSDTGYTCNLAMIYDEVISASDIFTSSEEFAETLYLGVLFVLEEFFANK